MPARSCVEGSVWHGATGSEKPAELRRRARDGSVEEALAVEGSATSRASESNGEGAFWCGGAAGTLLVVRPRTS